MSFFSVNKDVAANKESTGGSYLNKSGIYPVTINFVSVQVGDNNDRVLDFNLDYNGNSSTIYGLRLDNKDGSKNFQADVFNRLCNVLELDGVSSPEIEEHKVGKEQTPREFAVLPDFSGQAVFIRVQEEYSKYNGEIKERLVIKNFYRASDGASASEILAGDKFGEQLKKDKAYADNITYKDGVTAEDVAAWKASRSSGGSKPSTPAPVVKKNAFAAL